MRGVAPDDPAGPLRFWAVLLMGSRAEEFDVGRRDAGGEHRWLPAEAASVELLSQPLRLPAHLPAAEGVGFAGQQDGAPPVAPCALLEAVPPQARPS